MNYFDKQNVNDKNLTKFTIEEILLKANEALVNGEELKAEKYYKMILDTDPNHPDANHNLGLINLANQKAEIAIKLFLNAINANSEIEQFWISYIEALITTLNFKDAHQTIKSFEAKKFSNDKIILIKQKLFNAETENLKNVQFKSELERLLNLYNKGRLVEAEDLANSLIKKQPNHPFSWKILGSLLGKLGRETEAFVANKKAVELSPNDVSAHNNLGNSLKGMGKLKDAEVVYKKAIFLDPNFHYSYNNLGITLAEMARLEEAEKNYRKAIKINSNFDEAYFNLGYMFFESNQFQKAIEEFKLTNYGKSKSYLLRCYYLTKEKKLFNNLLDDLIKQGEVNAMIGSLCTRSKLKYGFEKTNLFCEDPISYVLSINLNTKYEFEKIFINTAMKILNENVLPYREQSLLTNGKQTAGNIFNYRNDYIKEIERIIRSEVENYKLNFKDSSEGLIKCWPKEYDISGWLISMKNGSQIKPHMHERGWLSGSVYINVPTKIETNSGNLVVCIEDDKFIETNIENPKKIIPVETGSLALFPASLLHYTIPFESEKERIVLAFDVVPK